MKTLLFPNLTLTSLTTTVEGELRRVFTAALSFSLLPATAGQILPEDDGWVALGKALPEDCVLDLGLPKPRAEWLMAGKALAPAGTLSNGLPVEVTVDGASQTFITGDAHAPKTATSFDLPRHDPARKDPRPSPLPVPILQKPMHKLGTFDENWLKHYWPGPPKDFDWTWYNQASRQSWRDKMFTGLETVRVTNMHADHAVLEASLPDRRLRLFADYGSEEAADWHEVSMQADTLWLLPNDGLAILFWHGSAPTRDERSTDILEVAACLEKASEPAQGAQVLIAQAREANAPESEPAMPEPEPEPEPEEKPAMALAVPAPDLPDLPDLPASPPPPAPEPEEPPAPEPAPEPAASETDEREGVPELVQMANEALAQLGLPPITPEDVYKVMDQQKAAVAAMPKPDEASTERLLAKAGFGKKRMDDLFSFMEMPIPAPEDFRTPEAYEAALQVYGKEFARLTGAGPDLVKRHLAQVRELNAPEPPEAAGGGEDDMLAGLAEKLGSALGKKVDAKGLESALTAIAEPGAGDLAVMEGLGSLASIMGSPPGEAMAVFVKNMGQARAAVYASPEMQEEILALGQSFPGEQAALQRLLAAVQKPPEGELFDLSSLAASSGVRDQAALARLAQLDPWPMLEAPEEEEAPEKPEEDEKPQAQGAVAGLREAGDTGASAAANLAASAGANQDEDQGQNQDEAEAGKEEAGQAVADPGGAEIPPSPAAMLDGRNLAGANLAGICLANAQLAGADLTGADLSGTDLSGASLARADLTGAKLAGAKLAGADLTGADLGQADLTGADATDATFDNCRFGGTKLGGLVASTASFMEIEARGQDFADARLDKATFQDADLEKASFAGADLTGATFQDCRLDKSSFVRGQLAGARLYDNSVSDADFRLADLGRSSWLKTGGQAVNLAGADLTGATFEECALPRASLLAIRARECRFLSCDLHAAHLEQADLMRGALRDTRIGDAILDGANLYGADLYLAAVNSKTSMIGADITLTCLNRGEKA